MAYTDLITTITTLTAIIVTFIAWQQWKTNKEKLRLDLYNRRFDVYTKTLRFLYALDDYDTPTGETDSFIKIRRDFITAKQEAQFLFKSDSTIFETLDCLHKESFKITGFHDITHDIDDKSRIKMHQGLQDVKNTFHKIVDTLSLKMAPYLNFHNA